MRILRAVLLVLVAAGLVSAQSHFGSVGGFGNVVFPGIGHAPRGGNPWGNVVFPAIPQNNNAFSSVTNPAFSRRLGGLVTGFKPYNGGGQEHRRIWGAGVYSYAYPVYVGGDAYGYGPDQSPAQPNVTVVYPPPQPPVVINQNFGPAAPDQGQGPETAPAPNMRLYQAPSSAPEAQTSPGDSTYYLIALKDHTIYSAVAYYVEGDTLHYFTSGNVHNQISLSLVDRNLTEQLNRERNVSVQLPH